MTADQIGTLGEAVIRLVISLLCVLFALGVIPIAKPPAANEEKLQKIGWLIWVVGIGSGLWGLAVIAGMMI